VPKKGSAAVPYVTFPAEYMASPGKIGNTIKNDIKEGSAVCFSGFVFPNFTKPV
jgi:hypothetical protein